MSSGSSNFVSKYFENQSVLCSRTLFFYDQESKCMFLVLDWIFNYMVIHTVYFTILFAGIQGTFNFYEVPAYQVFTAAPIQKGVMLLNSYVLTLIQWF